MIIYLFQISVFQSSALIRPSLGLFPLIVPTFLSYIFPTTLVSAFSTCFLHPRCSHARCILCVIHTPCGLKSALSSLCNNNNVYTYTPLHTPTHLYTLLHTSTHPYTPLHTPTHPYTPPHTPTHLYTHAHAH